MIGPDFIAWINESRRNLIINAISMKVKFDIGDIVVERIRPTIKFVIVGFQNELYYCKPLNADRRKPIVYMERDLVLIA